MKKQDYAGRQLARLLAAEQAEAQRNAEMATVVGAKIQAHGIAYLTDEERAWLLARIEGKK